MKTNLPTAQRIRLALENDIVDGRFQPGDRIDPEAIAADYGCSRTPVREALQALEASGLLIVQPKRGTFVAKLGVTELMERFELMAEMEGFCARLACRRADDQDHARIQASLMACETAAHAGDSDRYYAENTEFHQAIYHAAHNAFLEVETLRLQAILQPYRRRQLQARGRVRTSLDEHRRIAHAIRDGDEAEAGRIMQDHVLIQGERFRDLVALLERFERRA
ncbi:GntR family transcriptional regulator [Paracoccus sp. 1_MG-2023]|uniref:GntR family transcriptional regulator n=1 Tax=unclassified Paracoccus (in: a-proteobacteria) TaxID=2688777 RepID=UPI001C098A8D|nr:MULTISPECIES: GntR family transcriptional regulator [unclassified Paracoccus (in: a-proteobacteria)]MBU2957812.1 GntR family transcriptional regulator [Paracoccus sp. C2R09]MDO6667340.1 GntR family transcriptional regulator [Paracoccus sp. 1_MG-2023]